MFTYPTMHHSAVVVGGGATGPVTPTIDGGAIATPTFTDAEDPILMGEVGLVQRDGAASFTMTAGPPQGATITKADLRINLRATGGTAGKTADVDVSVENADDAAVYADTAGNRPEDRTYITSVAKTLTFSTLEVIDLITPIQTLVNRAGYAGALAKINIACFNNTSTAKNFWVESDNMTTGTPWDLDIEWS